MRGRFGSVAMGAALFALVAAGPVQAQTLDQHNDGASNCFSGIGFLGPQQSATWVSWAQTFTAGLSGTLDQVDVKLRQQPPAPVSPVTLEIRNVVSGLPGTTVLASASIPAASVPASTAFVSVTFPTPATVAAGTQYAIVLYITNQADVIAWDCLTTSGDPYTGGVSAVSTDAPPPQSFTAQSGDQLFRTYVSVPANVAPVASDDTYSFLGRKLVQANPGVLGNDTDSDGDSLRTSLVAGPANGTLSLNRKGGFTYRANEDFVGTDTFTYKASDGTDSSNVATVSLTVQPACDGLAATIVGTQDADILPGTSNRDVVVLLGGNDEFVGGDGNDRICGGSGDDTLSGEAGNDTIRGGTGSDTILGGTGFDNIFGQENSDSLNGGANDDKLDGGTGVADECDGDTGTDTAVNCETTSNVP